MSDGTGGELHGEGGDEDSEKCALCGLRYFVMSFANKDSGMASLTRTAWKGSLTYR